MCQTRKTWAGPGRQTVGRVGAGEGVLRDLLGWGLEAVLRDVLGWRKVCCVGGEAEKKAS